MVKMNTHSREQTCPACGGVFTATIGRRKKVQCPKCREVVTLPEEAETENRADLTAVRKLSRESAESFENLRMRIETLEHQVEAMLGAARPRSSLILDRLHAPVSEMLPEVSISSDSSAPARPREAEITYEPAGSEIAQPDSPAEPPKAGPPLRDLLLLVTPGDAGARRVARVLPEILAQAGWRALDAREDPGISPATRGLILSAGPALPLPKVTRTLEVLRDAGFAMAFQIDPERGMSEAALIVGADCEAAK